MVSVGDGEAASEGLLSAGALVGWMVELTSRSRTLRKGSSRERSALDIREVAG